MTTIQDLHKNDKFRFNDKIYTVKRKYINETFPLIANSNKGDERFYYEGLEIEKID